MDKVRFGRALGYGARHAAKSLLAAADAAAAPSPAPRASGTPAAPTSLSSNTSAPPSSYPVSSAGFREPATPAPAPAVTAPRTAPAPSSVEQVFRGASQAHAVQRRAVKQARSSILAPFAKFSTVVSLQVSGSFFALIALIMAQAVWRSRNALHLGAGNPDARRAYLVAGVALVFTYFALSNFLRARRRDRKA